MTLNMPIQSLLRVNIRFRSRCIFHKRQRERERWTEIKSVFKTYIVIECHP